MACTSFAEVHECFDNASNKKWMVKFFKKKNLTAAQDAAFKKEMEALLNLDHPNILKLREVFDDEYDYSLVVEPIPAGYDLMLDITSEDGVTEKIASTYIF